MGQEHTYRRLVVPATLASIFIAMRTLFDGFAVFEIMPEQMIHDLSPDNDDISWLTVNLMLVYLAALVGGVVFFIATFVRANRNLRALGRTDLEYTPKASIWWWFVPFAHLVVPYRIAVELFRASDPITTGDGGGTVSQWSSTSWKTSPVPPLVQFWWGAWVANAISDRVLFGDGSPGVGVAAFGMALELAAAVGAILVLRTLSQRQETLAAHSVNAPNLASEVQHVSSTQPGQ